MASLFIDSTYDITLGILDDELGWIKFERFTGQKSSAILQKETHKLLTEVGIKPLEIKNIITVSGPGFYTGLRLSEGVADVFKFAGIKNLSFLSYDIPFYLGVPKGSWLTKAYRGEYFFHQWDGEAATDTLIQEKDLETHLKSLDQSTLYTHSDSALDEKCRALLTSTVSTHELLKLDPKRIFKKVIHEDMNHSSFYFRAPEDEFRVSK